MSLVSSAFLARLLLPEDFGLMAIALILVGLTGVIFELGVETALIQNHKADERHYNTAWTIRIIQCVLISFIVVILAPFAEEFYEDARVAIVMNVAALGILIRGFENIGIIKFRKDLEFDKDFSFNVVSKLCSVIITIGLAYYYKSYLALVLGTLSLNVIQVLLSYKFSDYKPRFSLIVFKEIWSFSQWILVDNIGKYIANEGDKVILSKLGGPVVLGYYQWSKELSFLATNEITFPLSRALTPGFAKLKDEPERLNLAFLKSLAIVAIVVLPMALGLGTVSEHLIPLYLGDDKWDPVIPMLEVMVYSPAITCLFGMAGNLLIIVGEVKWISIFSWIRAIVVLLSFYPLYKFYGILGIIYGSVFVSFVMFVLHYVIVISKVDISALDIFLSIWRPIVSSILMVFSIYALNDSFEMSDINFLMFKIIFGAFVYVGSILLLWRLFPSSISIETYIISIILKKISR